ncbi:hypothetical protein U1Q18_014228 [Sarracenia purpurea var. burkii]
MESDQHERIRNQKIILSQEKSIQKLNELVRSLREQLIQCKDKIEAVNNAVPAVELLKELEQQQILED